MRNLLLLLLIALVGCRKDYWDAVDMSMPYDGIPYVEVLTDDKIVDEPKVAGVITIENVDYPMGIEIRGNVSQKSDKKSYGFETVGDFPLFDMPEEEDWILLGQYIRTEHVLGIGVRSVRDPSLLHNVLGYELWRQMGRYASNTKYVELEINGKYQGVYMFMEKLKRDKNRIALNKLKDDENDGEDLTGGYIIKMEAGDEKIDGFLTDERYFFYEYPKAKNITFDQMEYIRYYINLSERSILEGGDYSKYIDVDSFVDYVIINEFTKNFDSYKRSVFLQKDKNGKLVAGPIWDLDNGYTGNKKYSDTELTFSKDHRGIRHWIRALWTDDTFRGKVQQRWNQLRAGVFSDQNVSDIIDMNANYLIDSGAIERNYDRWNETPVNYEKEITKLKNWTAKRSSWLDSKLN